MSRQRFSVAHSFLAYLKHKLEDLTFPLRMHLGHRMVWDENRQIVQVSRSELIKGPCTKQEIEALQAVQEFPIRAEVPVSAPRMHRLYHRRHGVYIAMEFARGTRLDDAWPLMDLERRHDVVEHLWAFLLQLRDSAVARVAVGTRYTRGAVRDAATGAMGSFGPYEKLADFQRQHLLRNPGLAQFARYWTPPQREWPSVFTHADVAPRNVVVRHDGTLCLLDWEFAGWWPSYWEQVKWHFADFPPLEGWVKMMDKTSGWTMNGEETFHATHV